jgi:hypothetical protein
MTAAIVINTISRLDQPMAPPSRSSRRHRRS